jgi:hypothetical protein
MIRLERVQYPEIRIAGTHVFDPIGEVIQSPEKCLILTDSLSSVRTLLSRKISHRTHSLVYKCQQMCSDLLEDGVEVEIMWIPSHVGLESHEIHKSGIK